MTGTAIANCDTATLTTRELCAATGATERQIQWWSQEGILRPQLMPGPGYNGRSRVFPRSELPLARLAVRLGKHYASTRRRVIAAIRRAHVVPPYFVVFDRLGRRVRFAECGLDVIEIAIAAKGGVLVCEVKA
jgi:hypothetical protein